jgi:two-component system, NarL family, uhpT operon response regulator UhpA
MVRGEGAVGARPIKVAILDDHTIVSAGLGALIGRDADDVQVVWTGTRAAELRAALDAGTKVNVVLLDVMLGQDNPAADEMTAELVERDCAVLLVTMLAGGPMVKRALLAGAADYIAKGASEEDLLAAIHRVAAGDILQSREAVEILAEALGPRLSGQEAAVVRLYVQGLPLRAIARRLSLSENTCNTYLKRVRSKFRHAGLNVDSRMQMREAAIAEGLVDPEGPDGPQGLVH